jgi:hypothetical protein
MKVFSANYGFSVNYVFFRKLRSNLINEMDSSTDRHVTGKLLSALQKFGTTLNDYMHLFLPPIVRLFDCAEVPMAIRRGALVRQDSGANPTTFASTTTTPALYIVG